MKSSLTASASSWNLENVSSSMLAPFHTAGLEHAFELPQTLVHTSTQPVGHSWPTAVMSRSLHSYKDRGVKAPKSSRGSKSLCNLINLKRLSLIPGCAWSDGCWPLKTRSTLLFWVGHCKFHFSNLTFLNSIFQEYFFLFAISDIQRHKKPSILDTASYYSINNR